MSNFPTAIDAASTFYSPVDAFSTKPLETTANGAIGGGGSISVASTAGGFAPSYGIHSIDDELIVYTAKTGTQFIGCQRGAFGTVAATSITLTTAWQCFKITGTLAGRQTGLWIVVRQFVGNGDNWTSGAICLWGACLQIRRTATPIRGRPRAPLARPESRAAQR
jgi:hypothetical protein